MNTSSRPSVEAYLANKEQLGFSFTYPTEFVSSIEPIRQVVDEQDGGLGIWFLKAEEAARLSRSAASRFHRERLVPFARFDNGDWVCYFDADQPSKIFVTNLGESTPGLYEQAGQGYVDFILSVMRNLELPIPEVVQQRHQARDA